MLLLPASVYMCANNHIPRYSKSIVQHDLFSNLDLSLGTLFQKVSSFLRFVFHLLELLQSEEMFIAGTRISVEEKKSWRICDELM